LSELNIIKKWGIKVADEDEDGFAQYLRTDTAFAAQMPEPFTIDGMWGEARDFLVVNEGAGWPVNREIFEQTYALIEQEKE
jgi:hypothetical protein